MEQQSINFVEAQAIAERAIAEIIRTAPELAGYQFNAVKYRRDEGLYWVFSAASEQLIEEGYVPGAVFACVDKMDGHIWSEEEHARYAQQMNAHRTIQQPEAVAA